MVLSRFCRACAREVNEPCKIENNPGKPELPLLLKRYVPEFDINVENACLCTDCVSVLYIFHSFKRKSLRAEQTISLHIRKHPEVQKVNLNDIFAPKEQTNNTIDGREPSLGTIAKTKETLNGRELSLGTIREEITEAHPLQAKRKDFICEICCRFFCRAQTLRSHKRKYHGRERYQCDKCSRDFVLKKKYEDHLAYHKKPEAGLHTCKICNFVYHSIHSLRRHNISKHSSDDQKRYQCEVCAKRFVERTTLTEHMRTHTRNKEQFRCSTAITEERISDPKLFLVAKEKTNKPLPETVTTSAKTKKNTCELCPRVFSHRPSLLWHIRKYHGRERYQCDKCSRSFALKKLYDSHMAYHKKRSAGRHTCKLCNFVYPSLHSLRRHNIQKHSSEDKKPFQCEVCARRFTQKGSLKEHMRTHTGEKLLRKCSRVPTTVRTQLDGHIKEEHKTTDEVICTHSHCRRVFRPEKELKSQNQTLPARERYHCDQCNREFALEKAYHEHLEYHKRPGAGRYTCKECNFVYHALSALKRHNIAKHTSDDQKPFQCEVCAKRIVDKKGFTIHMRTHTGEKPFKCPVCSYAGIIKNSVYRHVSAKHRGIKIQFNREKCVIIQ